MCHILLPIFKYKSLPYKTYSFFPFIFPVLLLYLILPIGDKHGKPA